MCTIFGAFTILKHMYELYMLVYNSESTNSLKPLLTELRPIPPNTILTEDFTVIVRRSKCNANPALTYACAFCLIKQVMHCD